MSEWIEVNLPWHDNSSFWEKRYLASQEFLALIEPKIREIFGEEPKPEYDWDEWDHINSLAPDLPTSWEMTEGLAQELTEKYSEFPHVLAVIDYRLWRRRVDDWTHVQPEYIEYTRKEEELTAVMKAQSFRFHPLCRPGVEIEFDTTDHSDGMEVQVRKRLLIGDINPVGGVCDDCCEINSSDIVLRARVLVER